MIFGVDNFNYGHVFNADELTVPNMPKTIVYGGYTIKHEIVNGDYILPTWRNPTIAGITYELKTTVVGTDFTNLIIQDDRVPTLEFQDKLEEQIETANVKAQNYIDGITNDDVSRNNSNGNNGGNNNGGNNNGTTIKGCIDETAINYDETATEDDGSCEYETNDNLIYLGLGAGALLILMGLR